MAKDTEKKIDTVLDMTFPAADPPAVGEPTGTEQPIRSVDRRAPVIRGDEVESTAEQDKRARKRHRGVGRQGLSPADPVERSSDEQGLGGVGAHSDHHRRKG